MSDIILYPPETPAIPQVVDYRRLPSPTEALHRYLATKQAAKTRDAYAYDIQDFFGWRIPDDPEIFRDRVAPEEIQIWLNNLVAPVDEGGQGLAASSAKRKLSALRHFLEYCALVGLLLRNTAHPMLVSAPKASPWEPNLGLTTQQVRAMAAVCESDKDILSGSRDLAILSIGFACCLRVSEIASCSVHDFKIDRDATILNIPFAKGGRNEKVHVPGSTKKRIEDYLLLVGGWQGVKADRDAKGKPSFPVFISLSNRTRLQRLSISGICKIIKARGAEAGIRNIDVHSHLLRHSGITHLFELGWDIRRVQLHARHKDPKTTQLYHDLWQRRQHSAAEALGDIFEGKEVKRPEFVI